MQLKRVHLKAKADTPDSLIERSVDKARVTLHRGSHCIKVLSPGLNRVESPYNTRVLHSVPLKATSTAQLLKSTSHRLSWQLHTNCHSSQHTHTQLHDCSSRDAAPTWYCPERSESSHYSHSPCHSTHPVALRTHQNTSNIHKQAQQHPTHCVEHQLLPAWAAATAAPAGSRTTTTCCPQHPTEQTLPEDTLSPACLG